MEKGFFVYKKTLFYLNILLTQRAIFFRIEKKMRRNCYFLCKKRPFCMDKRVFKKGL